jgi:hypothetical protein
VARRVRGDVAAAAPERFVLAATRWAGAWLSSRALRTRAGRGPRPRRRDTGPRRSGGARGAGARGRRARRARSRLDDRGVRRALGRNPLFKGQPPEVAEAAHADRLRNAPRAWPPRCAASVRERGSRVGTAGRAADARGPRGRRTRRQYRKLAERMAAAIPRASCSSFPPPGTRSISRRPAIVAEAIVADRIGAGAGGLKASRAPRPPAPARAGRRGERPERRLRARDDPGTPDPTAALTASQLVGQRMIFSYDGTTPPAGCGADRRGRGGRDHPVRDNVGSARAFGRPCAPPGDPAPRRGCAPRCS